MLNFILIIGLLLVILLLALPVAFSLGLTSFFLILLYDLPLKVIGTTVFSSFDSFVILSVPLFILMSQVLLDGKIGDDLFNVMNTWVRHLPGGLAIATILACAFFSAITGSGAAAAVTIGMVAYPAMIERGYDKKFTLGLLAAGGTLGILIPPSVPMILYGSVTEESVGKLFIGGIIPGLVLTAIFIIYAVGYNMRGKFVPEKKAPWSERFAILRKNILGVALPFMILGGIYTGAFTPTEAAAVGLVYSLVLTLFIYKTLSLRDLPSIWIKSATTACMISLVIAGALLFGRVLTMLKFPQQITEFIISNNFTPLVFVIVMNLLMMVLGCILETVSVILLTMPLVTPVLQALNIDPIWYGIVLIVNMTLALITPPVGMNLYVIKGLRREINMSEVIKGVTPFIVLMSLFLVMTIIFPSMSTYLPSIMK